MISIVSYGLGNLKAFVNIYKKLNVPVRLVTKAEELAEATKIILPGVGAFDHAMQRLEESGMRETLDELVLEKKIPVVGICVGMQMMARSSDEGSLPGLGWIEGEVKKFDVSTLHHTTHLPHMGWNDVSPASRESLFRDFPDESRFYFLHSYYFKCHNPEDRLASTEYGTEFTCAVNSGNIFGVQFHPEKSHNFGIRLLSNFAKL